MKQNKYFTNYNKNANKIKKKQGKTEDQLER